MNELGHQRDYVFEYGTGRQLQTDGPNVRTCTTNCPPRNPIYPVKEQDKIRVDGLGRPIERWDTFSHDGSVYTLYQVATTSYVDAAPTSVTNRVRLDVSPTSLWTAETTELDGHGRPIKTDGAGARERSARPRHDLRLSRRRYLADRQRPRPHG